MKKEEKKGVGGLFIPAGVLLGLGFGFLYGQLVAGFFIGVGTGFVCFAIISIIESKR